MSQGVRLAETGKGMPFGLSFLVLPLVLHKPSRDFLPKSIATKFHTWVHNNQSLRVGFSARAQKMTDYTKESLLFGVHRQILIISDDGLINAPKVRLPKLDWPLDSESSKCKNKAHFLGRWLTRAGDLATIYAILGVKL